MGGQGSMRLCYDDGRCSRPRPAMSPRTALRRRCSAWRCPTRSSTATRRRREGSWAFLDSGEKFIDTRPAAERQDVKITMQRMWPKDTAASCFLWSEATAFARLEELRGASEMTRTRSPPWRPR